MYVRSNAVFHPESGENPCVFIVTIIFIVDDGAFLMAAIRILPLVAVQKVLVMQIGGRTECKNLSSFYINCLFLGR